MYIESENLDMAGNILADIFTQSHAGQELSFIGVPQSGLDDFQFLIHGRRGVEVSEHVIEKLAQIFNEVGIPVLRHDKPGFIPRPTFGPYLVISLNSDDSSSPQTLIELKMIRLEQLMRYQEALSQAFAVRFPANDRP